MSNEICPHAQRSQKTRDNDVTYSEHAKTFLALSKWEQKFHWHIEIPSDCHHDVGTKYEVGIVQNKADEDHDYLPK